MSETARRTDDMAQEQVDDLMESLPASRQRGPFYALTFRNYRLFFYGQTISVAGTWMQTVAQQWLVWELTHSPRWLGIVSGASAIPFVLFAVWGGQIADRHPRRTVLLITQFIAMLLAVLLAVLASNRFLPVAAWHVAVLAGLSGIVNAFNMPAQQAFVTDMVEDRAVLSNAIALNSLRFNLARVLGPMVAGIVLVRSGAAFCFVLNAFSYLAVIASLLLMRLPAFTPQSQKTSMWGGFTYFRSNLPALRIVVLIGAGAIFAWSVSTLYPAFADQFKVGAGGYSRMMSFNGIGAALAGIALAALAYRFHRRVLVYGGALAFAGALLLLTSVPNFTLILLCLILSGFAMIVFGISCNTKVQEEIPDDLRGRVMAVYTLVFQGFMPVGGLEIGYLAQHIGAMNAVRINAVIFLGVTLAMLAWSLLEQTRGDMGTLLRKSSS